jgi:hypothetical protein
MTNELEKKFFDTFGIEPEYKTCIFKYCKNKKEYDCENCGDRIWHYPQITDRILLNLICIANEYLDYPTSTNIKNIQARTLRMLLKVKKHFKDTYSCQDWHNGLVRKVRKLFKEK